MPNAQPLRVIIANDFGYIDGGSTAVAFDQARGLRARGHTVELFVGQAEEGDSAGPGMTEIDSFPAMSLGMPSVWDHPSRWQAAVNGIFNTRVTSALRTLVDAGDKNRLVVVVHSWTKTLSPAIFSAMKSLDLHCVLVLHDFFVGCPTGVYFDYSAGRHCERDPMSAACVMANCDRDSRVNKWWRVLRHGVAHTACGLPQHMDRLICVSHYLQRIVHPWIDAPERIEVLPNRVEGMEQFASQSASDQRSGFAFLGRLSEEKGARRFVHAVRAAGVEAVVVGDGPLLEDLRELLPEGAFTGWLDREDVAAALQRSIALVYPSLWRESFGLAVYEAASLGVPSIIPQGTAMTDFVRHEHNGLIFSSENELVGLLQKAAANPQWMAELGARARTDYRQYARTTYQYHIQLEGILREVVNGI